MRISHLLFLVLFLTPTCTDAVDAEWVRKWTADLAVVRELVPEIHPDPFTKVSKEIFDGELDTLVKRLPDLEQHEIAVELGRIVARLGDGHTRLTWPLANPEAFVQGHSRTEEPTTPALLFHDYPIRFGIYEEGVFVEKIDLRHARFAGARLVAIGGHPLDDAIEQLAPVIRHDNDSQLLDLLPMHMVLAEVLHARGLSTTPGKCTFTLETEAGTVDVELSLPDEDVHWHSAVSPAERPFSHRYLIPGRAPGRGSFERNYWFDTMPGGETVFLQFNGSDNDGDETILAFSERLRRHLEQSDARRLIIDLRYNWGGDNSLNRSLLHALIASDVVRRPGGLFVIIGRGTFSAAMMFAVDLEKHLSPVFVGEATGSSPVHFGDSRKSRLPDTGLILRISTLYWQYSGPRDKRRSIDPQVAVATRWADLREGRDTDLDAILRGPRTAATGNWSGFIGQIGDENLPIHATLGSDGNFTIEGVEPTSIRNFAFDGSALSFETDSPVGKLLVECVLTGDLLAGHVRRVSRPDYPVALALRPDR